MIGGASPVEDVGISQLRRSAKVKKPVEPTISRTEDLGCKGVSVSASASVFGFKFVFACAVASVFAFGFAFGGSGRSPFSKYRAACRYRA